MNHSHSIEPSTLAAVREAARDWGRERGTLEAGRAHADRIPEPAEFHAIERRDWPTLHLEDVSAIPFVSAVTGVEQYQHRARVRASDGDLFAAVTPMQDGYEPYCRDHLGLGTPGLVVAEPTNGPLAVTRACRNGSAFRQICDWASDAEAIAIHPYMAIEETWRLADDIRHETGTRAVVVGPVPPALWVANDKWALTELIRLVCGDEFVVDSDRAFEVGPLAEMLREFATRHDTVGLKRTRCASAMGNAVYDGSKLRRMPPDDVERVVRDFLEDTEWQGDEEVICVEWVRTDLSPSTQMWIPPGASEEPPVLQGIYEQLLEGRERVFVGSRPSTLPDTVHEQLAGASHRLAAALQELGYVGRCSFDFIVSGELEEAGGFRAQFTECNGRWGGTSTPMHLVDRLTGPPRPAYLAQDYVHDALVGASFTDVHGSLRDELFDPRTGQGRFVLYNVGPLESVGKFDVVSLGRTPDEALEGVLDVIPRRLHL